VDSIKITVSSPVIMLFKKPTASLATVIWSPTRIIVFQCVQELAILGPSFDNVFLNDSEE
jgi:hypothetical protein